MSTEKPERPRQPEAVLALVALVCGVLGALTVLVVLPQAGIVLGAFGVTAGWRGRQGNVRIGLATTGMVLGMIAVVVGVTAILANLATAPG